MEPEAGTSSGAASQTSEPFLETYLPYLLRRADQALSAAFYDALNTHGVPRSEWRVLAVLHEHGSLSVRDLTHRSLSPQPTVTHAVSRLEERGLVQRIRGTHDKRQRFVSMTPEGEALTATLILDAQRLERAVLDDAGIGSLDELASGLRKLIAGVERHDQVEVHHD